MQYDDNNMHDCFKSKKIYKTINLCFDLTIVRFRWIFNKAKTNFC